MSKFTRKFEKTILQKMLLVTLLIILGWGLHLISVYLYTLGHHTQDYMPSILGEAIVTFFILCLFVGYFPVRKLYIKIIIALLALFFHYVMMPVY